MTAEAVVMNKTAVALAADSAVTISGGNSAKTYETANKLFELVKGSNIGVLIYANAELNSTPWESIIKSYRSEHADFSAPHVEDYFSHFSSFLEGSDNLLRPDDEGYAVADLVRSHMLTIRRMAFEKVEDYTTAAGRVIKSRLHAVIAGICEAWEEMLDEAKDLVALSPVDDAQISKEFKPLVEACSKEWLYSLNLESRDVNRISKLALRSIVKDLDSPTDSGLVVAGFGTRDVFPKYVGTQVVARLSGQLLMQEPSGQSIEISTPGYFETFAQDGPAQGWVNGINSEVRGAIAQHWIRWVQHSLPQTLPRGLAGSALTTAQVRDASDTVLRLARKQLDEFFVAMDTYEEENFRQPMLDSISLLPKEELGVLAESLVNLTSLKQRMSIFQANTVGGAIDVALISQGDGFVWLKRKHYFSHELNPSWSLTHRASLGAMGGNHGA